MHVITRKRLNDFAKMHPDCEAGLIQWFNAMRSVNFSNIQEVRAIFPHADKVGKFTVFNIGGNQARLVAARDISPEKPSCAVCLGRVQNS
jgi:mRNA interferase HigB